MSHCAQLRGIAHGGQVLVSSTTADLVRESLATGIALLDLGEHLLKDLEQPEHVWQLLHPTLPADFPRLKSVDPPRRGAEFGKLLRQYRLATGMTQDELAEKAGLSLRGLSDLERGVRTAPHPDSVRRLANALGLAPTETADLLAYGRRSEEARYLNRYVLPIEPSELIGREHELSELRLVLKSCRVVTLTGPGGIGKTRLAVEVARRVEEEYDNGAVYVDLAPVADRAAVVRAAAQALGVREEANRPVVETVLEHLAVRQVLVVLDNCEHLLDAAARLTDALVRQCGEVRILATSREPMRILTEVAWPVPPLRIEPACELFDQRARAAYAALKLSDDDRQVVANICHELEGIPLAIELAAARVPSLALPQIAARLTRRLRLLSSGRRLDSPRHQALRAAIDWSYALLSERERALLSY